MIARPFSRRSAPSPIDGDVNPRVALSPEGWRPRGNREERESKVLTAIAGLPGMRWYAAPPAGWSASTTRSAADPISLPPRRVPAGEFTVLLAHEPDIADEPDTRRGGFQLSGHTHGGQIVLPILGVPLLPPLGRRYRRGLHRSTGHPVYGSRRLGTVPPYLRLNCPPEVTLLTLASA